uniref:Un-named sa821 n=1 Tax=Sinocyclocheilus grahami TaxID=75366 RepID=A0A672LK90_SINGR
MASDQRKEPGVVIKDGWSGYSLELFNYPEHYRGDLECVFIPHGVIMNRIECLFCSDLVESIKAQSRSANRRLTTRVEFIHFKSYLVRKHRNHKHNTPHIHPSVILYVLISSQAIMDTGKIMRALLQHGVLLMCSRVSSLRLLVKRVPHGAAELPDYVGFVVPNRFVVGYALDYNEYFRDLNVRQ